MNPEHWPEDLRLTMAPAEAVDSLVTEVGILLNLMDPNPSFHPIFVTDWAALSDCSPLDCRAVERRLEAYFGEPLPGAANASLPDLIQALQEQFPSWPGVDPSGVVLAPVDLQGGPQAEVEARAWPIQVLLTVFLPHEATRPKGLTDATTVAGCSRLAREVIQARLEAFFGIPLPISLDLPVWRYCEAIQALFPKWPGQDPTEAPSLGQQQKAERAHHAEGIAEAFDQGLEHWRRR